MPDVNIKVTRVGVTKPQKEKLIRGATPLLYDIIGKDPQTTYVVIDGIDTNRLGVGDGTVTQFRARQQREPI